MSHDACPKCGGRTEAEIQREGLLFANDALYERWQETLRLEQQAKEDLKRVRSALRQIRDYVLLEYVEGDKPFQLAILAITALDETQDYDEDHTHELS
jgi:hypothetical protein